jgi:hypothetical protein
MRDKGSILTRPAAEALALDVLGWLAADETRIGGLLAASGLDPAELRRRAAQPAFLGFVLDHLLADEAMVLAFARETGHAPDAALRARAALPGGDLPHWT